MKTKVFIIQKDSNETVQDVVLRTLRQIPMKTIITPSETKILINPNWVNTDHFNTGI